LTSIRGHVHVIRLYKLKGKPLTKTEAELLDYYENDLIKNMRESRNVKSKSNVKADRAPK